MDKLEFTVEKLLNYIRQAVENADGYDSYSEKISITYKEKEEFISFLQTTVAEFIQSELELTDDIDEDELLEDDLFLLSDDDEVDLFDDDDDFFDEDDDEDE